MIRTLALAAVAVLAFHSTAQACPTHDVTVPTSAGTAAKEVQELLDTPFVKLVSITLRKGTTLAKHATTEAITLQAISGSGKVRVGATTDALAPGHVVLVAPGAEHEIVPDGQADLVVLVHFLKAASSGATPAKAPTCAHCAGTKAAQGHEHAH